MVHVGYVIASGVKRINWCMLGTSLQEKKNHNKQNLNEQQLQSAGEKLKIYLIVKKFTFLLAPGLSILVTLTVNVTDT